jgi:hypothetical protein
MLAEMDSRLQMLQQELESVAVPIARRGPEQRRPARRPDGDPLAVLSAEHQAHEDVQVMEPEPPPLAPERPARAPRALTRAPRSPRPPAPEPAPAPAPFEDARMAEEARTAAELLPAPRSRAGRRGPAVARTRPLSSLEETPRRNPPTIAAAPASAPSSPPVAPPPVPAAPPAARSSASEAVVRQTILEAEEEARRVVDNARDRIAEIGARTRALLEHSLGAAPEPAPETPPAPSRRRRASAPAPRATPEQRSYHGAVTVEAGPFADVGQLDEFEDALASVPGIEDVYIRTFERYYAHFELSIAEPTSLIAELQARVPEQLRLIDSGDRELRLEIVRDEADRAPRA